MNVVSRWWFNLLARCFKWWRFCSLGHMLKLQVNASIVLFCVQQHLWPRCPIAAYAQIFGAVGKNVLLQSSTPLPTLIRDTFSQDWKGLSGTLQKDLNHSYVSHLHDSEYALTHWSTCMYRFQIPTFGHCKDDGTYDTCSFLKCNSTET